MLSVGHRARQRSADPYGHHHVCVPGGWKGYETPKFSERVQLTRSSEREFCFGFPLRTSRYRGLVAAVARGSACPVP